MIYQREAFSLRGLRIQFLIGLLIFLTADLIAQGVSVISADWIRPIKLYFPVFIYENGLNYKYLLLTSSGAWRIVGILLIGGFIDNFVPTIWHRVFKTNVK